MSKKICPSELCDENLAYVLNRCHKSLMRVYESQKHMTDELLFVANLAKTTEKLVKEKIAKQKINNNGE